MASEGNMSMKNFTTVCSADVDDEMIDAVVSKVVPIFFGLIGVTGLIGNCLVVVVILSNPQMKSTTNMLIVNLAMADLLFVIFCIPFTAVDYLLSRWPFGDIWCKTVQYLIVVTVQASIYTLVLMSFDRFLCVVYPIASRSLRTERNTILAILIIWCVILTISIPVIFAHGVE
ncbi:Allatostatin-A receptor, partial [Pseudolycoriella hygida]